MAEMETLAHVEEEGTFYDGVHRLPVFIHHPQPLPHWLELSQKLSAVSSGS